MTPLTAVVLPADIYEEGPPPVWLALALIALVLEFGVDAARGLEWVPAATSSWARAAMRSW